MRGIFGVVALTLAALPVAAFEGKFAGQTSFVVGNRYCPIHGPALKLEIMRDGKVIGDALVQSKAVGFNGTVAADGKLNVTYKAPTDNEIVTIEGLLTDTHLEGFSQSGSCRYKISLDRQ
jgi:uncharacterized protein YdeI (BOF family)